MSKQIRTRAKVTKNISRDSARHPTFKLFRSTSKSNRCAYVGSAKLGDAWYAIEADVVEHVDALTGKTAKHFEGQVFPQSLGRQMLKSAGLSETQVEDLLTPLEERPFDDIEKLRGVMPDVG